MKINSFIGHIKSGGAERVALELTKDLINDGIISNIYTISKSKYYNKIIPDSNVIELGSKKLSLSIFELHKILKKQDYLIAHMTHEIIISYLASIGTGCKIIGFEHNNLQEIRSRGKLVFFITYFLIKIIYPKLHKLICVSEGLAKDFEKIINKKCFFKYNCVVPSDKSLQRSTSISEKEWNLCFVGRNVEQKNFKATLDFVSKLKENSSRKIILNTYGEGFNSKDYCDYNFEIKNHGFLDNIENIYLKNDFLIFTSKWEGFGNVLVEAIYYGCTPILKKKIPFGPDEIIKKLGTGLFIDDININEIDNDLINSFPRKIINTSMFNNVNTKNILN